MKFGIIAETKPHPDERVALTPTQCVEFLKIFPTSEVCVEPSSARRIMDEEYFQKGISLCDDISNCDVLLGVKEVSVDALIPDKTYLFFSHTIKKQPYNKLLLKTVLERNIRLIDYECLTDANNNRILGFGRFAGLVGAYNGLWAWGQRTGGYELMRAYVCRGLEEMNAQISAIDTPLLPTRVLLTGRGRVGHGAIETLLNAGYTEVDSTAYLLQTFDRPVFTVLEYNTYYKAIDGGEVNLDRFIKVADKFTSNLLPWLQKSDMYIAGHFWKSGSPAIVTAEFLSNSPTLQVIADISCDIAGPIASTLRASTIEEPIYGYDPTTHKELAPFEGITVMAVDNLPCELPRDASEDFGNNLLVKIIPAFFDGDRDGILERATIARDGLLTEGYAYLGDYESWI